MDFDSMTEKEAFKAGFKQYCQQNKVAPETLVKAAELPKAPTSTWGGYLTNTNSGLWKDVKDYFTHSLPETWNPFSEAFQSADARYKNLPDDRALLAASRYAAATGVGSAAAAGAVAAGAPAAIAGLGARGLGALGTVGAGGLWAGKKLLSGAGNVLAPVATGLTAGTTAGLAAGGAAATSPSTLGNAGLLFLGAPIAAGLAGGGALGWGAAKATDPKINEDDIKAQELEQAYKIQARRLKARREYEKYREARGG